MGSVNQRPDGMWRARYRDPDGREHAKHFARKADAVRWVRDNDTKVDRREWVDLAAMPTFAEFAEVWAAAQRWRPATAKAQAIALRAHLNPRFGTRKLHTIRTSEVQSFARGLAAELGPGSVRNVLKCGRAVFRAAIADGLVARSPFADVKIPTYDPRVVIPTAREVAELHAAAPDRWKIAVTLGAAAGLRTGEMLALSVDRVDFLRRQLRVDRQLVDPAGGGTRFAPPKSARSTRTVPLPDVVVDELAAHVAEHGTGAHGLVVVDEFARAFTRPRWSVTWGQITAAAGVTTRFHDLRHRFASTLLAADPAVPLPAIAQVLGDTEAVLLKTYSHTLEDGADRVRAALRSAFQPSTSDFRGLHADSGPSKTL